MYIYKYKGKMYLKNNKIFIYVFIITTLAYHEQFLSDGINDEEEKIPEEYYCKGCCNCNIFTVNLPFTNKDLIDKFAPNNQIENFEKKVKTCSTKTKSKLLELHELLTSDFDLKKNTELEEENLEDYEKNNDQVNMDNNDYKKKITKFKKNLEQVSVLCKYKKKYTQFEENRLMDPDRIIGRFIKIKNRIPCLFFQTILQIEDQNDPNFQPKKHKRLIIYFHGLGDSIANYFEIDAYNEKTNNFEKTERRDINALLDKGFDLAIIEYKGGGYYDGDCDEEDFRNNDARDIFTFFSQLYKNDEIITLGYSLGCAFASQFTAKAEEIIKKQKNGETKNRIKACILIYPFINIKQAGKHIFETLGGWWGNHFSWIINPILKLRFDNKKWVSNIHSDLLLVNNKNDVMCNEKSIMPLKDAFLAGEGGELSIPELDKRIKIYTNQEKYLYIIESNSIDHFYINWQEIITFLEFLGDQYTFKTK